MEKDITPKKTILFLAVMLSVSSYFALDHHYKSRAKDVIFTMINSSSELIKVNDFIQFSSNLKNVMSKEPYIKAVQIFDREYRRLINLGDEIDAASDYHRFNDERIQLIHKGPLEYAIKYIFQNDSDLIMITFLEDDDRYLNLFIMVVIIFVLFGFIYFLCQRLDIDNLNSRAARHAMDLMSCGFHEMKQTVELFRILQTQLSCNEVTFRNPSYKDIFAQDFKKNMIAVDSMMSILKLTNKNGLDGKTYKTDLKQIIEDCIDTYQNQHKSMDVKYEHRSKLRLPEDILYATIGNLIKNAYTYSDSLIWIRTTESADGLTFSIANTGKMIPREHQKAILKPGIALKGQTGLGLHICQTWCKRIAVKLRLESTNTATQFSLTFPAAHLLVPSRAQATVRNTPAPEPAETNPATESAASVKSQEEKVVAVIDDIETFRVSICEQISELCNATEHFANMDMFLDQLKDSPKKFNYILIDRHGDGFDAIRDRFPDSCRYYGYQGKIILYSSDIPEMNESEYRAKGFDYLVRKGQQINWAYYLS
ncbi:MAG: HAMP domain-containing histidine kinase [Deltaproteobacteria bacterium]|nr:HAMP domain-containing histidine kinase [Deltaproteobacteria bacterium]